MDCADQVGEYQCDKLASSLAVIACNVDENDGGCVANSNASIRRQMHEIDLISKAWLSKQKSAQIDARKGNG